MRREKFQFYESKCNEVADGLYLSGESPAKNLDALKVQCRARAREGWSMAQGSVLTCITTTPTRSLQAHGITHIVNAVSFIVPNSFEADGIKYMPLRCVPPRCLLGQRPPSRSPLIHSLPVLLSDT